MKRYGPLLATLVVIAVNAAANLLPINGIGTGEVSARYPTGFTPAGWVFSIWSLIYVGLLVFSLYAARAPATREARAGAITPAYFASCVANVAWIFLWHHERIAGSLVAMLVLLASLAVAYAQLRTRPAASGIERLCVDAPFSLYLGWITTASLANLAVWFVDRGAFPFGLARDEWALVTVVAATALYTAVGVRTRDAIYTAVFAWAALGIWLQTAMIDRPVRLAAVVGCTAALIATLVSLVRRPGWIESRGGQL